MTTVAVANQKGGVAKTSTTGAMASILSRSGARVLAIDLDPQGNFTDNAKIPQSQGGAYAVLKGESSLAAAVRRVELEADDKGSKGYDILPASIFLASLEQELNGVMGRECRLKEALCAANANELYDFAVIDTPPALGTLTVNALCAADYVVIPTMADVNSARGIGQLSSTIGNVRKYFNSSLKIAGVLLTRFDPRLTISKKVKEVSELIAASIDAPLFDTYIRSSVAAPEANFIAQDLFDYRPNSTVAQDYEFFVKEFRERTGV